MQDWRQQPDSQAAHQVHDCLSTAHSVSLVVLRHASRRRMLVHLRQAACWLGDSRVSLQAVITLGGVLARVMPGTTAGV